MSHSGDRKCRRQGLTDEGFDVLLDDRSPSGGQILPIAN